MRVKLVLAATFLVSFTGSIGAQVTRTVTSAMDIYQAGGNVDASGGVPPLAIPFAAGPGQTITIPQVTGTWTCQSNLAYYTADGTTLPGNCLSGGHEIPNPVGVLSPYAGTDFAGAMAGVFLEDNLPAVAPLGLRFYISNNASGGIKTDFTRLAPEIGQIFFIGDGLTGNGVGRTQTFVVPPTATHLYLGYVDSCSDTVPGCFGDNAGQVTELTLAMQIPGLCPTGQTAADALGCTSQLVTPNPLGGGPNQDGNWELANAYPFPKFALQNPCILRNFEPAWVDSPNVSWLRNGASSASEWITVFDGENPTPEGYYVYRTRFKVPALLANGQPPQGLTIGGQLASDNATYGIYVNSPGGSSNCALLSGQPFPINPAGDGLSDFQQWWPFELTSTSALTPGTDAYLYFVVQNAEDVAGPTPTGLRAEFTASSFH